MEHFSNHTRSYNVARPYDLQNAGCATPTLLWLCTARTDDKSAILLPFPSLVYYCSPVLTSIFLVFSDLYTHFVQPLSLQTHIDNPRIHLLSKPMHTFCATTLSTNPYRQSTQASSHALYTHFVQPHSPQTHIDHPRIHLLTPHAHILCNHTFHKLR